MATMCNLSKNICQKESAQIFSAVISAGMVYRKELGIGRHDQIRTGDLYHVKVAL